MANEIIGGIDGEVMESKPKQLPKRDPKAPINFIDDEPSEDDLPIGLWHPLHGVRKFTDLDTLTKALKQKGWVDSPAKLPKTEAPAEK